MKEYKVGQVLFLIGEKTTKVMPIQIIEEVIRTTLDGKKKTYIIQLPDKIKTKVDISDVKGQIFNSHKEVRNFMVKNASSAIDKMIANAKKIATIAFQVEEEVEVEVESQEYSDDILVDVQQNLEDNIIKIDLGDGQIANVSTESLDKLSSVRSK